MKKCCLHLQIVICFVASLMLRVPLMLVTVAETDGEFESVLPKIPSIGPYRLDVCGNQTCHIQGAAIVDPQKLPAGLAGLRKICLIRVHPLHASGVHVICNLRTEVIEDAPGPYLLHDILIFFRVEDFEAQGVFEVAEGVLLVPPKVV